jgi:hypothetical protein
MANAADGMVRRAQAARSSRSYSPKQLERASREVATRARQSLTFLYSASEMTSSIFFIADRQRSSRVSPSTSEGVALFFIAQPKKAESNANASVMFTPIATPDTLGFAASGRF